MITNKFFANKSFIRNEHFPQNRSFAMNTFLQIVLWLHTSLALCSCFSPASTYIAAK